MEQDTLNLLKAKLNEVLAEYEKIEQEQKNREKIITSLRTSIQVISNPNGIDLNSKNGITAFEAIGFRYSADASWKERIISYIKYASRAVTTSEISEAIAGIETHLATAHVNNMVSGNMSALVKEGHVKAFKLKKMKGQYYANPKWFDANGNIIEKYKPEERDLGLWQ